MRPTFKESDCLVVSKTQFGLNIPLKTSHFLFKPEEVKRMGVVVFTGENMDIPNVKTNYFYLFPGHKQLVKRMIGLPGDRLYFYGGKIYGIDQEGNDISSQLQLSTLDYLEHIPYINQEGKLTASKDALNHSLSSVTLHQMNIPIAKLSLSARNELQTKMLYQPNPDDRSMNGQMDLYNIWGIENFANARILPKTILEKKGAIPSYLPTTDYYLELTHHPSVQKATIQKDPSFRARPMAQTEKSYIPLSESHLHTLWENIYTARFTVKNGYFWPFGLSAKQALQSHFTPKLKGNIPNGTYEFYNGKLYQIRAQGYSTLLPSDHPLAKYDPQNLFTLFNAGFRCDSRFLPLHHDHSVLPERYAYFRNGDLFVMGAPLATHTDSTLQAFIDAERSQSKINPAYLPFIDQGAPLLKDGTLDIEKINRYGLRVPDKHYLVLGDNHAMSGDSREFGFVPQENIRGTPSFLFWAPGGRYGLPQDGVYHTVTTPRIIVWTILGISLLGYGYFRYRQDRFPISFD